MTTTPTPFGWAAVLKDTGPPSFTVIPNYPLPPSLKSPHLILPFFPKTLSYSQTPPPSHSNRFLSCRGVSGPDPPPSSPDAIGALADLLCRDYGVTEEEALGIVSRAPGYIARVVKGVRELEEVPSSFLEGTTFEEKVAWMARRKNDGGKVAFFESLGMSSTSALNVSRYLSSHSLPYLLRKVRRPLHVDRIFRHYSVFNPPKFLHRERT